MCGVVAYIGSVNPELIDRVVYESTVRGTHHTGHKQIGNAGIYHTRYCTSGETNQPIKFGERYLAFNGVIDMGTKKEMEKRWSIKMETDNDGEIFLQKCKSAEHYEKFLRDNPMISFAGVVLTKHNLVAIRNPHRPLWVLKQGRGLLIASTLDIFIRAKVNGTPAILNPFKAYVWTI